MLEIDRVPTGVPKRRAVNALLGPPTPGSFSAVPAGVHWRVVTPSTGLLDWVEAGRVEREITVLDPGLVEDLDPMSLSWIGVARL